MKQIKIIRGTVVNGKPQDVGQVLETDDSTAALLIGMGKAELYTPVIEKPINRAIGLETSTEEPVKRVMKTRRTKKGR